MPERGHLRNVCWALGQDIGVDSGVTAMVQASVGSKIPAGPGHCRAASLSGLTKLNHGHVACHFLNSEWKDGGRLFSH